MTRAALAAPLARPADAPGEGALTAAERSDETRERLLAEAQRLFAERGYAGASTSQIAEAAGVTRGALHHHFPHKRALFEAVYRALGDALTERLRGRWSEFDTLPRWVRLHQLVQEALDQATDPAVQQIVVIDGPAVLRLPRCHQASGGASYEALHSVLADARERGLLDPALAVDAATYLLFGACANAAHWIATSDDPSAARRDAGRVVAGLLESMRPAAP